MPRLPAAGCSCALLHDGPQSRADAGETVPDDAMRHPELVGGGLIRVALGGAESEDVTVEWRQARDLPEYRLRQLAVDDLLLHVDGGRKTLVDGAGAVLTVPPLTANAVRGLEAAHRGEPGKQRVARELEAGQLA